MTKERQNQIDAIAKAINDDFSSEEVIYLTSKLKKTRLDEMQKANPYGAYLLSGKRCPVCGK